MRLSETQRALLSEIAASRLGINRNETAAARTSTAKVLRDYGLVTMEWDLVHDKGDRSRKASWFSDWRAEVTKSGVAYLAGLRAR